jgi:hypothetical protein
MPYNIPHANLHGSLFNTTKEWTNADFTQLSHCFAYGPDTEGNNPSIKLVHLSKCTVTFLDPTLSDIHDPYLGIIESMKLSTVAESCNGLQRHDIIYTTTFCH